MSYLIRLATESDCEKLSKLKHDVWNETYRGIYSDEKIDNFDYEKNKNKFLNLVANPEIELYVVEDEGLLVGYMDYGIPLRPYKDYEQEIGLLYLLKDYQRKGIGKELFELAYNKIKEKGFRDFFVCCNKYNTNAHKFYEKMGGKLDEVDDDNDDKSISQVMYIYEIN